MAVAMQQVAEQKKVEEAQEKIAAIKKDDEDKQKMKKASDNYKNAIQATLAAMNGNSMSSTSI